VRVCVIFSPYLYHCCYCSLCLLLLNCPYPDPTVSAYCFPFSYALWRGEGRLSDAVVAGSSRNQNIKIGAQRGAGIMAGLSSGC